MNIVQIKPIHSLPSFLSSLIDSREFFQPVLTPFELEVALNPNRDWEPKMVTDFRKLLPGKNKAGGCSV